MYTLIFVRLPFSLSLSLSLFFFFGFANCHSSCIGEGDGTPLQYSCLENPMDGGASLAAVHGVLKSQTRLNEFTLTFHFHALEKEMATHSSVLAWRIPGTGEPGGLPSTGSHRIRHDWSDLAAVAIATHPVFLKLDEWWLVNNTWSWFYQLWVATQVESFHLFQPQFLQVKGDNIKAYIFENHSFTFLG